MYSHLLSKDFHIYINSNGYSLHYLNNSPVVQALNGSTVVQSDFDLLIENYNPLPSAKLKAKELVKDASAIKRLEYVTNSGGKDAEYVDKREEARLYNIDQTVGDFMQGRIDQTNESPSAIAIEWNAKAISWKSTGVLISALEDSASRDIDAQTDWKQCDVIAKAAIKLIVEI